MLRSACIVSVLLMCGITTAQSKPWVVEGFVRDAQEHTALSGASVTLEWNGAIVTGVATDSAGHYSLTAPVAGAYRLVARHVSYTSVAVSVEVTEDSLMQDFYLEHTTVGLEEIEVSAGPFQPASDVRVAITKVSAQTIRALAGAGEDVLQALRVFPGVQTSGDYSTQLYIRGGTADQNLILIDDIEVFSPYQLSGMGSLLNPELIREVELYAGTMPAEYGDRLSSALVVTTREGRADGALHGRLSTTMMTVNTTLEGATGFWGGSWIASGRKTYFGSFANTFARRIGIFNEIAFPNFADGHFKLALRPSYSHIVRATVLASRDKLDWVVDEDVVAVQGDSESLYRGGKDMTHTAVGMQWHYVPDEATTGRLYANWYENSGGSSLGGGLQAWMAGLKNVSSPFDPPDPVFPSDSEAQFAQRERYAIKKLSAGARIALARSVHSIEAGAGLDRLESDLKLEFQANDFGVTLFNAMQMAGPLVSSLGDSADVARADARVHFFAQDKVTLLGGAAFLQPALRFDYYRLVGRGYWTPRLSISIPMGEKSTARLASGRYVQSPGLEKTLDPDDNYNIARLESLDGLAAEEAWHVGVSLSQRFGRSWRMRLQGYHSGTGRCLPAGPRCSLGR